MTRLNNMAFLICFIIYQQSNPTISAKSYSLNRKDVPIKSDLENYLKIIAQVSQYSSKHNNDIDVQLAFGIFVTIVNIQYVLKVRETKIPSSVRIRMKNIITENEQFLQRFLTHNTGDISNDSKILQITHLFTNPTIWMLRLKDFTYTPRKKSPLDDLEKTYMRWDQYMYFVNKIEDWKPSPNQSDVCLAALSANSVNKKESLTLCPLTVDCQHSWRNKVSNFPYMSWCPLLKSCKGMLLAGSNFGYALTHRLLLLIMARHARGCSVLSEQKDKDLSENLCSMAYDEAQYISLNNYGHADLMLEIMLLCSIEGHSEFLRRSWLKNLQKFQYGGCFSLEASSIISSSIFDDKKGRKVKLDEICNKHITALATGTYSSAIRYIVQMYY